MNWRPRIIMVFAKHKVEDYVKWKQVFDEYEAHRKASGETSYNIGHVPGEPNSLCLLFGWDNIENAKAFINSDDLKATMQKAGVLEAPDITFFETVEAG